MKDTPPEAPSPAEGSDLWTTIEHHVVAAGVPTAEMLTSLRTDVLRSPDPGRALTNLARFLEAGFSTSLVREFHQFPALQRTLLVLLSQSQYLSDILVRDPELFRWLTASDALSRTTTKSEVLEECRHAMGIFQRIEKKIDAVKRIHRREYLRIGAREILREAGVRTTTSELSELADAVVEAALEIAHADVSQRIGAAFPSTLAAVGLGKLGGQELNFSSDIDLMFVYERDEPLPGLKERVHSTFDFYRRVAEFAVRMLSDLTSEGRLYRVDLRLRPDGASGPLVMSLRSMVTYYETRGELWERQMLLKARIIAGNQDTGRAWTAGVMPFVYPKTLLRSPLVEIAGIKRQIEERLGFEENVKLGSGGIRDIEFTVQALQLLYGGANEPLRLRNTLDALDALESLRVVNPVEASSLREAYEFFRVVEHRLQLLHGFQTHALPEREEEYTQLALRLGFESSDRLRHTVGLHRRKVRLIYDSVFSPPEAALRSEDARSHGLERVLTQVSPQERPELTELLARLTSELDLAAHPEISEALLRALIEHGAPAWAVRNLLLVAGTPAIRRGLLQSLRKPELATLIVLLSARSSNLAALLAAEPLLFETLVSQPEEFFADHPAFTFLKENDLRRFQRFNEFKASLQFFLGTTSFEAFARALSDLAGQILAGVVEDELASARRLQPVPPMCLIGLGKLGGEELTVGSDLDCVVLYRGEGGAMASQAVEHVARRILDRFRSLGLYSIDLRLRPEGHNAPLGAEFTYVQEYFSGRASLWELQSLLKARSVAGDAELGRDVLRFFHSRLTDLQLPARWVDEILAMRERMAGERVHKAEEMDLKLGPGGLVDLEFAVQMLQLRYAPDDDAFLAPNTFDAVRNLHERGYLSSSEWKMITKNAVFLRTLETLVRLNTPAGGSVLPKDQVLLEAFAQAMRQGEIATLFHTLEVVRSENRSVLHSIAERCRS